MRLTGRTPGLALGAAFACFLAAWAAFPLPHDVRIAALDVLWIAICAAAAACLWSAAAAPANAHLHTTYRLLGTGCAAWGAGQAVWTYHEVVAGTDPFPSGADLGFLTAAMLLLVGVLSWPGALRRRPAAQWAMPAVSTALAGLAAFELVVEGFISDLGTFAGLVAFAYPMLDVLMLSSLVLVAAFVDSAERPRLMTLGGGLVALLVADALFQHDQAWTSGTLELANLGWAVAFTLVGATPLVPARWSLRVRVLGPSVVGALLALLVAAVMLKEFTEDLTGNTLEAVDSLVFGLAVVALVWVSWRTVEVVVRSQDALAHESALRHATMEASRTGNCVFALEGDTAFWNEAFASLLFAPGQTPSRTWAEFVGHLQSICAETGVVIAAAPGSATRVWTTAGRYVEIRIDRIATGEVVVAVDDLTDREREAATRARFVAEVVSAQEEEARRIAELLHDDAVQQLTALALRLELAALKSGDDSLEEIAASANGITGSLRSLLIQLHPAVLESQGLRAAIEVAAGPLRAAGVQVRVRGEVERLSVEIEQLVYRLVQEALANALKHARARRVEVELAQGHRHVRVRVRDDGAGFDVDELETAVARGHLGLHLVHERVDLANGFVRVDSAPGRGTTIEFEIPHELIVREEIAAVEATA